MEEKVKQNQKKEDENLANQIEKGMFGFNDICNLDSRYIQKILKETSTVDFAAALKTASEEVKQIIYGNMSERAAKDFENAINQSPASKEETKAAQEKIINLIKQLNKIMDCD